MEPQIRYCTTADGVSIAWVEMGQGPGEILVPDTVRGCSRASSGSVAVSMLRRRSSSRTEVSSRRRDLMRAGFDEGVRLWGVRWQAEGDQ